MDDFTRREFMRLSSALAAALAVPACGGGDAPSASPDAGPPDAGPAPGALPTLGGAPDSHEGRVIAAFCDTVVPGRHRDPMGAPGAIDVGAPALFFDPTLPALPYVGLLVITLDAYARRAVSGATFEDISPQQREVAVATALGDQDLLDFAIQLAKLAFYSAAEAGAYLGYPGPNPGYWSDPDFSFGRAMSREITKDGNLP